MMFEENKPDLSGEQSALHEEVLDFALTEPRIGDMAWDEAHVDWATEIEGFQGPIDEILDVVDKWEHWTIDEFARSHRAIQLDELRMVVNGKSFNVTSEDVEAMPAADTTLRVSKHVFPTQEDHPALSDFDVRFMSPNTAIALYHRSELGFEGEHFESNAAVILVKDDGNWRVSVFTRAPLPEYPGDRP